MQAIMFLLILWIAWEWHKYRHPRAPMTKDELHEWYKRHGYGGDT